MRCQANRSRESRSSSGLAIPIRRRPDSPITLNVPLIALTSLPSFSIGAIEGRRPGQAAAHADVVAIVGLGGEHDAGRDADAACERGAEQLGAVDVRRQFDPQHDAAGRARDARACREMTRDRIDELLRVGGRASSGRAAGSDRSRRWRSNAPARVVAASGRQRTKRTSRARSPRETAALTAQPMR